MLLGPKTMDGHQEDAGPPLIIQDLNERFESRVRESLARVQKLCLEYGVEDNSAVCRHAMVKHNDVHRFKMIMTNIIAHSLICS